MKKNILALCLFMIAIINCSGTEPTVNVISDYSFEYGGVVYNGRGTTRSSSSPITATYTNLIITKPAVSSFLADGFFVISGTNSDINEFQYTLIYVTKSSSGDKTAYWGRGNFEFKIWLRFGKGEYDITVHKVKITNENLNYEGAITSWIYYNPPVYTFSVLNTRDEDGKYYYPSAPIQSDDSNIHALAIALTANQTGLSNKLRALHDFVITNTYYDFSSTNTGLREKQDAVTVLTKGYAVCEGYTCLYNALIRSLGTQAKYMRGGNHAWTGIDYNSDWSLVDTTWDDLGGTNIKWQYFMKTFQYFIDNGHTWVEDRNDKAITVPVYYKMPGYPDGIY